MRMIEQSPGHGIGHVTSLGRPCCKSGNQYKEPRTPNLGVSFSRAWGSGLRRARPPPPPAGAYEPAMFGVRCWMFAVPFTCSLFLSPESPTDARLVESVRRNFHL